jgi:hypothetical protein
MHEGSPVLYVDLNAGNGVPELLEAVAAAVSASDT